MQNFEKLTQISGLRLIVKFCQPRKKTDNPNIWLTTSAEKLRIHYCPQLPEFMDTAFEIYLYIHIYFQRYIVFKREIK